MDIQKLDILANFEEVKAVSKLLPLLPPDVLLGVFSVCLKKASVVVLAKGGRVSKRKK